MKVININPKLVENLINGIFFSKKYQDGIGVSIGSIGNCLNKFEYSKKYKGYDDFWTLPSYKTFVNTLSKDQLKQLYLELLRNFKGYYENN